MIKSKKTRIALAVSIILIISAIKIYSIISLEIVKNTITSRMNTKYNESFMVKEIDSASSGPFPNGYIAKIYTESTPYATITVRYDPMKKVNVWYDDYQNKPASITMTNYVNEKFTNTIQDRRVNLRIESFVELGSHPKKIDTNNIDEIIKAINEDNGIYTRKYVLNKGYILVSSLEEVTYKKSRIEEELNVFSRDANENITYSIGLVSSKDAMLFDGYNRAGGMDWDSLNNYMTIYGYYNINKEITNIDSLKACYHDLSN